MSESETNGNAGSAHIDVVPRIVAGAAASLVAGLAGPLSAATGIAMKAGLAMGAAIVGGVAVAGIAIIDFSSKLGKGTREIRQMTGETGENLKELGQNFRNIVGTVAGVEVDQFSLAIARLHQRTDQAGPGLESLAQAEIRLAKLTKEDLGGTIESSTKLFEKWGIAGKDQVSTLDFLYKTSEKTGVGVGQLTENLVKFQVPLSEVGFTFEQSAALLAKFDQSGVNTAQAMGALRFELGKAAKEGKDPLVLFQQLTANIKGAGTEAAANAYAVQLFGAKSGPELAKAIREGRLEVGDLLTEIKGSPETLKTAEESTRTFGERVGVIFSRLGVIFEPVGKAFLTFRSEVLARVENGVNALISLFQGDLPTAAQKMGDALGVAANAPAVAAVLRVFKAFQEFGSELRDHGLGAAFEILKNDLLDAWPSIRATLEELAGRLFEWGSGLVDVAIEWGRNLLAGLAELFPRIRDWIVANGPRLLEQFHAWGTALGEWVAQAVPPLLQKLGEWLGALVGWIFDHLPQIIGAIALIAYNFVKWVGEIWGPLLIELGKLLAHLGGWIVTEALPHIWEKLKEWGSAFWEWIQPQIGPALEKLGELLAALGHWITDTALPWLGDHIGEWASKLWEWVKIGTPIVLARLGDLLGKLGAWITGTALPWISGKLGDLAAALWGWIQETTPKVLAKLGEWAAALGNWITETALPWVVQKLTNLAIAFVAWLVQAALNLPENLWNFAFAIAEWIRDSAVPWLTEKAGQLIGALLGWLDNVKDQAPGKLAEFGLMVIGFVQSLPEKIANAAGGMFNGITNAFLTAINWIIRTWNGLKLEIPQVEIFGQTFGPFSFDTPDLPEIPYLADGGRARAPGFAVVGDQGAEILKLGAGDTVFPLDRVSRELEGRRGRGDGRLFGDVNIHEANNPGAVVTELDSVLGWAYGTRQTG